MLRHAEYPTDRYPWGTEAFCKTETRDPAHRYAVDKVLDVCRAACQTVGGVGDRYTYLIRGRECYLWLEKGRWFVAAKE